MSYDERIRPRPTGWVGWILFAAAILIVNGLFGIIAGLAGIFRDEDYFRINGKLLVFNYRAWGWIHLIIGIGLVLVGVFLYRGSFTARLAALFFVILSLLAHFSSIDAYPWWSLIAIALNILVIYALVVHGEEMNPEP
jgi:hypothetical protein